MTNDRLFDTAFQATPIVDYQFIISRDRPSVPGSYSVTNINDAWIGADRRLPVTTIADQTGRPVATLIGFAYSEFHRAYLSPGTAEVPLEVESAADLERRLLPRLAGTFVALTMNGLPPRLYLDHGGSLPTVYSPQDRRAASSPALLLDEASYGERFRADLHAALVVDEGVGGWIPGTLTAHRGVSRLLPNHYLDLEAWTAHRFWPQADDFNRWRDVEAASEAAATALNDFCVATNNAFKLAATLTAGFDTRLILASCRQIQSDCEFFTITAPGSEMDCDISKSIAERFGLNYRVLPTREASSVEMAMWDRAVGDCMIEQTRKTHPTLRGLIDREVVFTGMYGEVGRCRLYRQDLEKINEESIDTKFIVDRLTLPPHPEVIENLSLWLSSLRGQPNSVILDLAFLELKFGSWAMGQRPVTTSVKINLLPFAQRIVLDTFIGVSPVEKTTDALFLKLIKTLWPELGTIPVNKYGDFRDLLKLLSKLLDPPRVRRYLRDRLAKAGTGNRASIPKGA